VERLLSLAAFQLRGGGWYKDGYSSAKPASAAEKKPKAKPDAAKSSSSDKQVTKQPQA
jgi:hypothetical protein